MSKATTAREKLTAKVLTRTLDEMTAELTLLDAMEYSIENTIVETTYIRAMDTKFPIVSEIAWGIIEKHDAEFPEEYLSYPSALLLAREESGL